MKAGKTIIIILLVLIVLYFVYKYIFKEPEKRKTLSDFNSPREYHAYEVQFLESLPGNESSQQNNTAARFNYEELNSNLISALKTLGYNITTSDDGNSVSANAVYNSESSPLVKIISIKYPGNVLGIDAVKWKQYSDLGLLKIQYDKSNPEKLKTYYDNLFSFFGQDFFTTLKQQISEKITVVNKDIACNSTGYKQALSVLAINLEQAKIAVTLAQMNLTNYDNQENRDALSLAQQKYNVAKQKYETLYNKCN